MDNMYKELFKKAKEGDADALRQLRQRIDPYVSVFVMRDGELDVEDSLAAFDYYRTYGIPPGEWGDDDAPTCAIDQAFVTKMRRDPIKLWPLTGGVWSKLWDHENGHKWIAAFYWGRREGHLTQSAMELKSMAKDILDGNPGLMEDVAKKMEQLGCTQEAMDMVLGSAKSEVQAVPPAPKRVGLQSPKQTALTITQAELEAKYAAGHMDISRYLRLKEDLVTKQASAGTVQQRHIGLTDILQVYVAPSGKLYQDYRVRLSLLLCDMSVSELTGLAQQVGAEYRGGKESAVRGIVNHADRRGQGARLILLVAAGRPDISWFSPDDVDPASLRDKLIQFAQNELRSLCTQLSDEYGGSYYQFIMYDRLPGLDHTAKIDSLILWHRVERPHFFQRLVYHTSLRGDVLTFGGQLTGF